jgi:hypothetical protein
LIIRVTFLEGRLSVFELGVSGPVFPPFSKGKNSKNHRIWPKTISLNGIDIAGRSAHRNAEPQLGEAGSGAKLGLGVPSVLAESLI